MSERVTITDLARELSLSVCTINRALTGKPRIAEATRQRVVEAANRLGYTPNALARSLGRPMIKLVAIYPDSWPSHTRELFEGVKERLAELSDYRVEATFKIVPGFTNGKAFLRAIKEVAHDGVKGVIFSLGDYPEADMRAIHNFFVATGIPHVALSDALNIDRSLLSCVSHDGHLCGSLAGELLSLALGPNSETAIFIGRKNHHDHDLKIRGFKEELELHGIQPPEVCETFDGPMMAYPAAEKLFKKHPKTSGIFIGTENAQGILEFLEKSGRKGKVKVVATGISEPVAGAIKAGLVHASIHQRQRFQGRLAVETLFNFLESGVRPKRETLVPPHVLLKRNFPKE